MKRFLMIAVALTIFLAPAARACDWYFGDLHSHTSYSDGMGVPDDAYNMARYDAKVDFITVSDHYEQIDFVRDTPAGTPKIKEWDAMRDSARKITENGKFVGLAGYEWFDQSQGHMNVINTDALAKLGQTYNLAKFYAWLPKHPEILTGFNHPADSAQKGAKSFNKFALVPEVASQTVYLAVSGVDDLPYYYMALDTGWRVAPSGQQDNHDRTWGKRASGELTAVCADSLSYDDLIAGLRARRFYGTNSRPLRIGFEADGQPMGSEITAAKVNFTVSVTRGPDAPKPDAVQLITNGGKIVHEWKPVKDGFKENISIPVDFDGTRWYVALILAPNGKFTVSAPIWVKK